MPDLSEDPFLLPDQFKIKLEPYDDEELTLLKALPQWPKIDPHLQAGHIMIHKQPFLKYTLFRQRDIYSQLEIRRLLTAREAMLSGLIYEDNEFLFVNPSSDPRSHRPESEDIGEALGLCAADQIFGTSDLDWRRIAEADSKTFDTTASTGEITIEWESKGSIVHGELDRPSGISNHKSSIRKKKVAQQAKDAAVRLGSISVLRSTHDAPTVVYLVDPPVSFQRRNPNQIRLLNRLKNISTLISSIKPISPFSAALRTTVAAMSNLDDFSQLDLLRLLKGSGEPFATFIGGDGTHNAFFTSRSTVGGEDFGGHTVFLNGNWLFFYGMHGRLVELAASQNFKEIAEYSYNNSSVDREVRCVLSNRAFERASGNKVRDSLAKLETNGQYVSFAATGKLNFTAGGSVFGFLHRPSGI